VIKLAARLVAAAAGVIAVLVVIGWATGAESLKSMALGKVPMNPVTAFALAGSALAMFSWTFDNQKKMSQTLSFMVMIIGLLKVLAIFRIFDIGMDILFFKSVLAFNQMAPNTALVIFMIGLGMFMLETHRWASGLFFVAAFAITERAIHGYACNDEEMYRVSGGYIAMAFNTAVSFCLVSVGMLVLWVGKRAEEIMARKEVKP